MNQQTPTDQECVIELVARYGMRLERPPYGAVYPPDGLFPDDADDPFYDEHGCVSWAQLRAKAETYARIIEEQR
jgi:hypothetical protein